MKKKIFSIFGVVLTLVLVVSLFGFAVPASAGTLEWSRATTPSTMFNQIAAGKDSAFLAVAPDGTTLFAVDPIPATDLVYKSTNGGRTWTASVLNPWGATAITALAVSPAYATDSTVILAAGNQVYISTTGGAVFAQLGGVVAAGEIITCLDIAPTYAAGVGEIMVGTTHGTGGTFGDVYIWGRTGVLTWAAQFVGDPVAPWASIADVTAVAFSPNYPIDATILAVGSTAAATSLYTKVSTFGWDVSLLGSPYALNAADDVGSGTGNAIVSSAIAMGSDYNGSVITTQRAYVATVSGLTTDDIYQVNPTAVRAMFGVGDDEFTSLAYSGDFAAGSLFAGNYATATVLSANVWRCANPTAVIGWMFFPATTPPTGTVAAAGPSTYVVLAPDFATSNKVFASTLGTESAVSVSDDGGINFYQAGLIDTTLAAISDFQVSPAYATDSTSFMATTDNAGGLESLWRTTDGRSWFRVATMTSAANAPIVRMSPAYATDQTVYWADTGTQIMLSINGGASWSARISPAAIRDLLVADASTIYVAALNGVHKSINGGWTWLPAVVPMLSAGVNCLAQADNGDILSGDNNTMVYRSTNAGASFVPISNGSVGAPVTIVAFDGDYATNNTVYATGGAGIMRCIIGVDTATLWNIDPAIPGGAAVTAVAADSFTIVELGTVTAAGFINAVSGTVTVQPSAGANAGGGAGVLVTLTAPAAAVLTTTALGDSFTVTATAAGASGTWGAPALGTSWLMASVTVDVDGDASVGPGAAAINTAYAGTWSLPDAAVTGVGAPAVVGLVGAPDGTLYAADSSAAAAAAGGIRRSLTPALPIPAAYVAATFESVTTADQFPAGGSMANLVLAGGSNQLFGIVGASVYTYTDTLSDVSPELVSPADGAVSTTLTTLAISWSYVTGATSYDWQVSTRADFQGGIVDSGTEFVPVSSAVATGIPEGTTIYWRVRVATPVLSPWSSGRSVVTQLGTAVNAPTPLSPAPMTYTHVNVALAPVFNWSSLKMATKYEFQLANDAAFKSLIVNLTGAKALGNVTSYQLTEALAYSTTCYWRVRGISATGSSDWSAASGFTTMAKPVEAAPPVVVEEYQPPDIIVEIPPAEAPVSPGWIWAIVVIGAVLVIAVIVLIVRTRRPV